MSLKCLVRYDGDVCILDLSGTLSLVLRQEAEGNTQILETVRGLVDSGSRKFILNFAGIDLMDSAGIGQLIGTLTSTRSRGGQIKILSPTREVRKLLEVTQLAKVVEIHDDERVAVRSYGTGEA